MKREEELAEERRRREAEIAEERRQHEKEVQEQMRLLRELVEGSHRRKEAPTRVAVETDKVKLKKLLETDDVEAYLTTLERIMRAYEVNRARWAFKLAPQLTGKAQLAYAAMPADDAADYDRLKAAILKRYDITEETYRQRFRAAVRKGDETHQELRVRLQDVARKWMKGCSTAEEVVDVIVREQLMNTLAPDVRVWMRERKPKSSEEASELADDYMQARKNLQGGVSRLDRGSRPERNGPIDVPRCHLCKQTGHVAKDCRSQNP